MTHAECRDVERRMLKFILAGAVKLPAYSWDDKDNFTLRDGETILAQFNFDALERELSPEHCAMVANVCAALTKYAFLAGHAIQVARVELEASKRR